MAVETNLAILKGLIAIVLMVTLLFALAQGSKKGGQEGVEGMRASAIVNLARHGRCLASSQATVTEGKYGAPKAVDGDFSTRWASKDKYTLPQWFEIRWGKPQTINTLWVLPYVQPNLYDAWKEWEVVFSEGEPLKGTMEAESQQLFLRFPARTTTFIRIIVHSTYTRSHYIGITEIVAVNDPKGNWLPPILSPLPRSQLRPKGRKVHPCVFLTPEDIQRARRNRERYQWAREIAQRIVADADKWLRESDEYWLTFLPPPGACYAFGITGCPICGAGWGTWVGANCSWERPGKVRCSNGHLLPDEKHPDNGTGYRAPDGRIHYFVGSWNAWVTEQWTLNAIPSLAHAYALTGDERYAERAAFFLDALASIYAESTSGSWDYPSSPPSGRLARPWYQVARVLVILVEAYDLIYKSPALDKPSLRPRLEKTWTPPPWPQTTVVGTPEAHGQSWSGMTRRENIDLNLMQDAAYYCYRHTFEGRLHNGHADYLRGALAVGCLLNIPEYVRWAAEGPFSIYSMLDNNIDRDGRYYETSLMYESHTHDLYLSFAELLRNWKDDDHPDGIDLFSEPRFRWMCTLPEVVMNCAGHLPNFGDTAPDNRFLLPSEPRFSAHDYALAERMLAGSRDPQTRRLFASILKYLTGEKIDVQRARSPLGWWLLCKAEELPPDTPPLPEDLKQKIYGSWFMGQRGIVLLRAGKGKSEQAALLRFGPSLNHSQLDELGLIYYAYGWQLTYDIGYGFGSTHTRTGWAHRTASHNLVVVNERNQLEAPGSGGSLHLFATVPGLQLLEASAENAYRSEDVSVYRRTVALVGGQDEADPAYLVDIFRVMGGQQHDYFLGVQTQEYEVDGLILGQPLPGSLAGPEIEWGTKIGNDGDIIGYPNKPYWNPPPGNGYGFFYEVRPGRSQGKTWRMTWRLGGSLETFFRVHFVLAHSTDAETIPFVAKAPGLTPSHRSASYAILRRRGKSPLRSIFVAVMEPFAKGLENSKAQKPFLAHVEVLPCVQKQTVDLEPLGLRVVHQDGTEDYFFSGSLRDGRKVFATPRGQMEVSGAFVWMRLNADGKVARLVMHGTDDFRWGTRRWHAPTRAYEGVVREMDEQRKVIFTDARLPDGASLWGSLVCFVNDAYSRSTCYRLERVEAIEKGSRLYFGETSFLLGRGQVISIPDEHTLLSSIPHEYVRSLNGQSLFFNGKRISNGKGGVANIVAVQFGVPMTLQVTNTNGFQIGDWFFYYDIQPGDRFVIPTTTVFLSSP
jgi:hypothetical protein